MKLIKFVSAVASAGLLVAGTATTAVADQSVTGVGLSGERTVVSGLVDPGNLSGKASFMQFPFAESFPSASGGRDPRVVLVSFSEQVDSGSYPERLRTLRSVDRGKTFTQLATDVPITSMAQLADGSLVALNFRTAKPNLEPPPGPVDASVSTHSDAATSTTLVPPASTTPVPTTSTTPVPPTRTPPAPPPGGGVKQFQTTFWRSHDYGATWDEQHGTISAADSYDAVYFHRGIVAGRDGSLLAPTYGYLNGDPRYRSMLARSTDGGATWRIVSTIATSPAGWRIEGRSEPTMARAANGDLVVVMRQNAPVSPAVCNGSRQGSGLVISRSSDDGARWTPAQSLVGAGLDVYNVSSADPRLTSMPGGQLLLSYGRPGNKILVSADGNGTSWSSLTLTRAGTSSGYTSIVALTENTALQVGDYGSNWCFPIGSGITKVGIWSKTIELRPSDTKRIDLRSRYLNGSLNVVTNLTDRPTAAAGPAAAIDGSVDPVSAAVRYANDGYYQVDLGSPNVLTGASVALPRDRGSAAIDLSNDGRTWRTVAGWYSSGHYRSLTARPFPVGTAARYVRVRVTGIGGVTALGEVQLRTNASTFEDDLVGKAPQGFVVLPAGMPLVTVASGGVGLASDRAVRLNDTTSRAMAVMAVGLPQRTSRNLELGLRSNRVVSAFLISLEGRRGGIYQRALHLGIFPDGSLRRWTGSRWVNLSAAGLVKKTGWAGIRINANTSAAWVYVNGRLFSRVPLTPGTTSFTGIQVSSGGTAPVGDDMFIDQFRAS
ncbi:MAG: exo-alpha-sialidase [Dermatophilaceae bacterium]